MLRLSNTTMMGEKIMEELQTVIAWLGTRGAVGESWASDIGAVSGTGSRKALKGWLPNGGIVDTLQVGVRDGEIVSAWSPGTRAVTLGATYALFGESQSRRAYAGVVCLACDDATWLGYDAPAQTLIAYRLPA